MRSTMSLRRRPKPVASPAPKVKAKGECDRYRQMTVEDEIREFGGGSGPWYESVIEAKRNA